MYNTCAASNTHNKKKKKTFPSFYVEKKQNTEYSDIKTKAKKSRQVSNKKIKSSKKNSHAHHSLQKRERGNIRARERMMKNNKRNVRPCRTKNTAEGQKQAKNTNAKAHASPTPFHILVHPLCIFFQKSFPVGQVRRPRKQLLFSPPSVT